jgi:hypothetical protein
VSARCTCEHLQHALPKHSAVLFTLWTHFRSAARTYISAIGRARKRTQNAACALCSHSAPCLSSRGWHPKGHWYQSSVLDQAQAAHPGQHKACRQATFLTEMTMILQSRLSAFGRCNPPFKHCQRRYAPSATGNRFPQQPGGGGSGESPYPTGDHSLPPTISLTTATMSTRRSQVATRKSQRLHGLRAAMAT